MMRVMHDTPLAGHPGYFKTYKHIMERFTWTGLKDDVLKHVKECDLSTKQIRAYSSCGVITTITHPATQMGKCVHGLHHRAIEGSGQRLHICGGQSVDQVCTFLYHILIIQDNISSRVALQGGIQTP
jgi:hypothetical protein